ncbi:hypothetical protein KKH36_02475 [Patescibacteria group bacterium]|nr:hypothetical protein [Patescibacteria group bacterium]
MSKSIIVRDKMQKKYKYELNESAGKKFHSDFKPDLSPKEMLALGIFGGVYMRDCIKEFPKNWFTKAKFAPKEINKHLGELNYFKINASQPLKVWRKKGWINEEHDPRGWFQWYCRYYQGRRLPKEDKIQIARWKAMKRHSSQIAKNCRKKDMLCRPKQRQALLHWAYDSRKL